MFHREFVARMRVSAVDECHDLVYDVAYYAQSSPNRY